MDYFLVENDELLNQNVMWEPATCIVSFREKKSV